MPCPAASLQLEERDGAVRTAQARLATLQADFEHNLGLLEARDAELTGTEAALAAAGAELASKLQLIAQMQAALGDAEQGGCFGTRVVLQCACG